VGGALRANCLMGTGTACTGKGFLKGRHGLQLSCFHGNEQCCGSVSFFSDPNLFTEKFIRVALFSLKAQRILHPYLNFRSSKLRNKANFF
jgi:hypothetical protein